MRMEVEGMKKDLIRVVVLLFILAVVIVAAVSLYDFAFADEEEYFIICKPDGEVNVRGEPRLKSAIVGCVFFAQRVVSDGKEKNGFVHIINLPAEDDNGWIYKGLLVRDQPIPSSGRCMVYNAERVACRKYASTKSQVKKWLKDGSEVKVYAISEEWCVTNYGYIKTEFLTLNAKVRQ
jgi:hypothetical protein